MPSTYSGFRVKSISHLIRMNCLEKRLDKILNKVDIDKFQLAKLLFKLQKSRTETFRHSLNVANLTFHLAREIGLTEKETVKISLSALFHDVGKIFIDLKILDKKGRLSKDEWRMMKKHPRFGVDLLAECCCSKDILLPVLYHYEKIDGSGYEGLTGSQIPLGAKIISLTDSFDAMMSNRPYRRALSFRKSLEELNSERGSQFDPELTKSFIKILEKSRGFKLVK